MSMKVIPCYHVIHVTVFLTPSSMQGLEAFVPTFSRDRISRPISLARSGNPSVVAD